MRVGVVGTGRLPTHTTHPFLFWAGLPKKGKQRVKAAQHVRLPFLGLGCFDALFTNQWLFLAGFRLHGVLADTTQILAGCGRRT